MRALIADDEPLARKVLREELAEFPNVQVAGEAEDCAETLSLIRQLQPEVVFLDLQMPDGTGFDVIRNVESGRLPVIIVVTAYDAYAVQAFESGAVDYLLKPVSSGRLALALQRAERLAGNPKQV